ncbi:MAG: hypothetical protein IT304_02345, partial [Dehalococcoidia bacterium]|nr:hypothetical protein [Dehalococcoidia bacterium]
TLDWRAHHFDEVLPAPNSPATASRLEFETWRDLFYDVHVEVFPAVTDVLHWFEGHLPRSCPRVSLLKGNNGLGEEVWRDGRIVALSDWENAAIGDPALDWGFSQGMLELIGEERALTLYEQYAGFPVPRENVAFWRVWSVFKAMVSLQAGLRGFCDGRDQRAALATMGLGGVRRMVAQFSDWVHRTPIDVASDMRRHGRQRRAAATGR